VLTESTKAIVAREYLIKSEERGPKII
jgi:hypothetical protein